MKFHLPTLKRKFLAVFVYQIYVFHDFFRTSLSEEKRRLEGRLTTMEEDLEEEQMNYETAVDKARKAQEQLDSMSGEVAQHQSTIGKLESTKSQLEKQVRANFLFIRVPVLLHIFSDTHLSIGSGCDPVHFVSMSAIGERSP